MQTTPRFLELLIPLLPIEAAGCDRPVEPRSQPALHLAITPARPDTGFFRDTVRLMVRRIILTASPYAALSLLLFLTGLVGCSDSGVALGPATQSVLGLTIVPSQLDTVVSRDTVRLTAKVRLRSSNVPTPTVTWSSSDANWGFACAAACYAGPDTGTAVTSAPLVLPQDSGISVLAVPLGNGASVIRATAGGMTAEVTLIARLKVVRIAILPDQMVIAANTSTPIHIVALESHGGELFYDKRQLTLASSDSAVVVPHLGACVDGDCGLDHLVVVARQPGSATITASLTTVDGTFQATAAVTVKPLS
jgi:hypothetical protein